MDIEDVSPYLSISFQPAFWRDRLWQACTIGLGFDLVHASCVLPDVVWATAMDFLQEGEAIDLGQPKEQAEWLLFGRACAPTNTEVTRLLVEMRVAGRSRRLLVTYDRPFSSFPLTWENTWGNERENPDGLQTKQLKRAFVSDETSPFGTPACPRPRGNWPCRTSLLGTVSPDYALKRWPMPPEDMNRAFFNLAQESQRLPEGLHGDERFELAGLHPEIPRITGKIPARALSFFVERKDGLHEHAIAPDTVIFFPNRLLGMILWHALLESEDEAGSDIFALHVHMDSEETVLDLSEEEGEGEEEEEESEEDLEEDAPKETVPEEEGDEQEVPPVPVIPATPEFPPVDYKGLFSKELDNSLGEINEGLREAGFPPLTDAQVAETRRHLSQIADQFSAADAKALQQKEPELSEVLAKIGLNETEQKNIQKALDLPIPEKAECATKEEWKSKVDTYIATLASLIHPNANVLADLRKNLESDEIQETLKKTEVTPASVLQNFGLEPQKAESFVALLENDLPEDPKELGVYTAKLEELAGFPKGSIVPPLSAPEFLKKAGFSLDDLPKAAPAEAEEAKEEPEENTEETPEEESEPSEETREGGRLLLLSLLGQGEPLCGRDFTGFDLSDLDLSGHDLTGCQFKDAILTGTRFEESLLQNASFAGADCTEAVFAGANLSGADFSGAVAKGADFTGAVLVQASLKKICAKEADFSETRLDSALLEEGDFEEAVFVRSKATSLSAQKASFVRARFEEAVFPEASFTGANFTETDMHGSQLTGSDLKEAILGKSIFCYGTNVGGCDMTRAFLEEANWTYVEAENAVFSCVRAASATFSDGNFRNTRWAGSDLRGGDFSRSLLEDSDLRGVNLFEGSLREARLSAADFSMASLYGVDLSGAKLSVTTKFDKADCTNTILAIRQNR